jgi:hypothetical protein
MLGSSKRAPGGMRSKRGARPNRPGAPSLRVFLLLPPQRVREWLGSPGTLR